MSRVLYRVGSRSEWLLLSSARRSMRREALAWRATGRRECVRCAVIFRDLVNSLRS